MSKYSFDFKGKKLDLILDIYNDLKKIDTHELEKLAPDIRRLLANCWGVFPDDFVDRHIFQADKMVVAKMGDELIGICVMSIKYVLNLKIRYIEFLLVDKEFQKGGLGSFLSFKILRDEIISNLGSILLGKPLEIFFITPNIRVLSNAARFASFLYPNPYLADSGGEIGLADEQTWRISKELVKNSDNPRRYLDRNGLVLTGSYVNTPWLIYNNDNAPWHNDEKINLFAKRYLRYHEGEDREFIVRMHINLSSLIKYLFKK